MKILIYLDGNVFDKANAYAPIDGALKKITTWIEGGAEVEFITHEHQFMELKKIDNKFKELSLPDAKVHAKPEGAKPGDFVNELGPKILIENATNSGTDKTVASTLGDESKVRSVVLQPGVTLDDLPSYLDDLKNMQSEEATETVEE